MGGGGGKRFLDNRDRPLKAWDVELEITVWIPDYIES